MIRTRIATIASVLALLHSGCATADDTATAPLPSRVGVSARINNQVWQSATSSAASTNSYYALRGGINPNELSVISIGAFEAAGSTTRTDRITLALVNVTGTGTFPLSVENRGVFTDGSGSATSYVTDAGNTGTVTITVYDTVRGLVSGTLDFTAAAGSARVVIADGRFTDLPLRQ